MLSSLGCARRHLFLAAAAINNLLGALGSTPSGDLNPTCFPVTGWRSVSFSPLILRFVASRLPLRLCGPKGLPCCRPRLRGPEGLPSCRFRRVGLSFRSWPISLRVLLGAAPQLRHQLRGPGGLSSRVRRCGLLLRSSLRVPPSLSDLFAASRLCLRLRSPEGLLRQHHRSRLSLRPPSLRIRLGALSLRVRPSLFQEEFVP